MDLCWENVSVQTTQSDVFIHLKHFSQFSFLFAICILIFNYSLNLYLDEFRTCWLVSVVCQSRSVRFLLYGLGVLLSAGCVFMCSVGQLQWLNLIVSAACCKHAVAVTWEVTVSLSPLMHVCPLGETVISANMLVVRAFIMQDLCCSVIISRQCCCWIEWWRLPPALASCLLRVSLLFSAAAGMTLICDAIICSEMILNLYLPCICLSNCNSLIIRRL